MWPTLNGWLFQDLPICLWPNDNQLEVYSKVQHNMPQKLYNGGYNNGCVIIGHPTPYAPVPCLQIQYFAGWVSTLKLVPEVGSDKFIPKSSPILLFSSIESIILFKVPIIP